MVKEFIFNFLKVFVLGLSFLVLSSFFTKDLSADDSEGQGLIEQFGDQLKRLFGGREDSDKQSPEDIGGLSEYGRLDEQSSRIMGQSRSSRWT